MRISDWSSDVCSSDLRQSFSRAEHVAGAEGVARDRIFDRGDDEVEADLEVVRHHQPGQRERMRRAAHILLHQLHRCGGLDIERSEEHTSELQSLMRISYAVFCLKKKKLEYEH